jgi:3',5'-cyclic AMP phosphodiesterase CpdA
MRIFLVRALIAIGFVFLVACGLNMAIQADGDEPLDPVVRYGPRALPDRVILTLTDQPSTSQSVNWRTDRSSDTPQAQIALAEDGPLFVDKARSVDVVSQDFESELGAARYHSASFTALDSDTQYVYRVGDGANWSEWNQFRTASGTADPLKFIYVGDAQNDIYSMWSRLIRTGFAEAPDADFIIHAGDLVNRGNADGEWGEWFEAAGWINRTISSVPVPGNHEYPKEGEAGRNLSRLWRPVFALPENGPVGVEESCYFVDIQGVRVVALNSNEKQEEQAAWLDELLTDNPNRWTVVTHHHPIYSAAKSRDNPELRALWQPIYDKHGVDIVLNGHDHTYARSNLVSGQPTRSGGTVYVVSVSGPKMYELDKEDWMVSSAVNTQLFQVIEIDGDRLHYESRTARGKLYDAFDLVKADGQPNELLSVAVSD